MDWEFPQNDGPKQGHPRLEVLDLSPHLGFGDNNWVAIISKLHWAGYTDCSDIKGWNDPGCRDPLAITGKVASINYLKRCRSGDHGLGPRG